MMQSSQNKSCDCPGRASRCVAGCFLMPRFATPPSGSPKQLTLDFSGTTEKNAGGRHTASPRLEMIQQLKWQQKEQLVCKKFNGKRDKKGWLAPQYKYFDECGRSHTITDLSHSPAAKIYGPYWTYRWFQPGKLNDGNLYLGAISSKKFQHFSVVWQQCDPDHRCDSETVHQHQTSSEIIAIPKSNRKSYATHSGAGCQFGSKSWQK